MNIAMITSHSRAFSYLCNNSANVASTIKMSMSRTQNRNQQQASFQRRICSLLATTTTTTATTNAQVIQSARSSNNNLNGLQSSIRSKGQTKMMVASMGAQAQLKFEWEQKRGWEVTTPEDLKKRINRIRNLATEAQLCIQDCTESIHTPHFQEEFHSATKAVEHAEVAYSELLEELASRNQVELLNSARRIFASEVESVREKMRGALDRLKKRENR